MALEALSIIDLDTSQPFLEVVHAKQYDSVRRVEAHLFFSGVKWYVPERNIYAIVSFKKTDRSGGLYDVTEDGLLGVSVDNDDRSIIYIQLDKAILTKAGEVKIEVIFYDTITDGRLSGFSFVIAIESTALNELDLTKNNYFSLLSKEIAAVVRADQNLSNLILFQQTQPTEPSNKLWLKDDDVTISIPTMDDLDRVFSIAETYEYDIVYSDT